MKLEDRLSSTPLVGGFDYYKLAYYVIYVGRLQSPSLLRNITTRTLPRSLSAIADYDNNIVDCNVSVAKANHHSSDHSTGSYNRRATECESQLNSPKASSSIKPFTRSIYCFIRALM